MLGSLPQYKNCNSYKDSCFEPKGEVAKKHLEQQRINELKNRFMQFFCKTNEY